MQEDRNSETPVSTMTPTEMNAILAVHSARAVAIIPEGRQVPNGYELRQYYTSHTQAQETKFRGGV